MIPETEAIRAFIALWEQLLGKIRKNEEISKTLTSIRNMLLPKLLSGEISIEDAEKFVESNHE